MIFFLITTPMYLGLALWLLVNSLRSRAIRRAVVEHAIYEADRVGERKRPGFHGDHKEIAIQQRAQRTLYKYKIAVKLDHVRKVLGK
jgi:hypothetical protein